MDTEVLLKGSLTAADEIGSGGVDGGFVLSPARWWVLFVYSLFAFTQGMLWAIPGPISAAMAELYNISDDAIQLMINWGPILYIPLSIPLAYWMDKPGGIRQSVIWGIVTTAIGQVFRTIARDTSPISIGMLHLSYILNAIAGPVAMGAVGKISEDWFPPEFRATSTAIMSEANLLGGAAAQLIGPTMVASANMGQMMNFMYVCCAIAGVNLLAALIYFPSHPPTPPSRSAVAVKAAEDTLSMGSLWVAIKALARNRSFMVLILAYGLSTGMYGSWATVLSINLNQCDPQWIGWLSFSSTIAGNVGGLLLGRFADRFRNMKRLLVGLMAGASASFVTFAVLASGVIKGETICHPDGSPASGMWPLFVLGVMGGLFLNSSIPLFYELSMEVTYGAAPEATVCTMMTNMNNVGCLIFLSVPVNELGSGWMNWMFAGTILLFTLGLIFFFEEKTLRYDVDTKEGVDGLLAEGEEGEGVALGK
jgi:FLVCR family MFS transporter